MNPLYAALTRHAAPLQSLSPLGAEIWEQEYTLPPDFIGFSGHFPEYPLVPAVVQVMMAQHTIDQALGQAFDRPTTLRQVSHAKFLAQIFPDSLVRVRVERKDADTWHCTLLLGETKAAQFGLKLEEVSNA